MEKKPTAIFNCGPTAAGKSSTTRYFQEKGYDTGVVLDYDKFFKEEHDRIKKDMPNLDAVAKADVADQNAYALREKMFESCLKHKQSFSYENCMPGHAIEKMAKAKEAGFDVKVYVTFQNSVDKHIDTEKFRRDKGTETGAFFHNDKDAEKVVRSTYQNCLNGLEKAVEHSDSMKVYINYMDKDPEKNKPKLVGHYKDGKIIETGNECTNKDVKASLDNINKELTKSKTKSTQVEVQGIKLSINDSNDFKEGKEVLVKGVVSTKDPLITYDIYVKKDSSKKEGVSMRIADKEKDKIKEKGSVAPIQKDPIPKKVKDRGMSM